MEEQKIDFDEEIRLNNIDVPLVPMLQAAANRPRYSWGRTKKVLSKAKRKAKRKMQRKSRQINRRRAKGLS